MRTKQPRRTRAITDTPTAGDRPPPRPGVGPDSRGYKAEDRQEEQRRRDRRRVRFPNSGRPRRPPTLFLSRKLVVADLPLSLSTRARTQIKHPLAHTRTSRHLYKRFRWSRRRATKACRQLTMRTAAENPKIGAGVAKDRGHTHRTATAGAAEVVREGQRGDRRASTTRREASRGDAKTKRRSTNRNPRRNQGRDRRNLVASPPKMRTIRRHRAEVTTDQMSGEVLSLERR